MLLSLKVIIAVLTVLIPLVQLFRDWKYHDRRTRRHHQCTRVLLIGYPIIVILTVCMLWYESRQYQMHVNQIIECHYALGEYHVFPDAVPTILIH